MSYANLETDFNEVSTLGNFILEKLSDPMTMGEDSADVLALLEMTARLGLLSCKLYQKGEFSEAIIITRAVVEVVGAMFILHFQMKSNRHLLSEITSDPQIRHFLRWIKSGASHHGNGVPSHPMIDKAIDYLDEWLGGIRWQYDAVVELCNELLPTPFSRGSIPGSEPNHVTIPAEYAMRLISKILVNFLTIGIVLYDEIINFSKKINRPPAPERPLTASYPGEKIFTL